MKIFVDSSAWIAYFNRNDDFHSQAVRFLKTKPRLVTSNLVLHETIALLENQVDRKTAEMAGIHLLNRFLVELILASRKTEETSFEKYKKGSKKISFVDWTNFSLMKESNIQKIFAFDRDFEKMGLKVVP